ncbi:RING-H2 finger protein ATL3-like [Lucilia cuprina]|uniref:RING-H2 finger protein ATL3-like n=1 Tax=Lucilia cuprina TaxID=7375 RepID=UPI001F058DA4|nr:RING-H2 finger protein ATL3-like [Lucilia cuprina]
MLSHTPVKNSGAQAAKSPQPEQDTPVFEKCHICSERKDNKIKCWLIVKCNHSFHRACIENFLSENNACPVCNLSCELSDLKRVTFPLKSSRSRGAKSRGAQTGHQYTTRSMVLHGFQDTQTPSEFPLPSNANPSD